MKDRVDLLCQLIGLECVSAVNAGPRVQSDTAYADLLRVHHAAQHARESWVRSTLPEGLDMKEPGSTRSLRARLLEALSEADSMAAYGAPTPPVVDLSPELWRSGAAFVAPAGLTIAPGFDREAFRRDTAARILASIAADPHARCEVYPARLVGSALEITDVLLARLEQKPEDRG